MEYIRNDVSPADQPPMLVNAPTQRNLLTDLRASWTRQLDLCSIGLYTHDLGTCGCRPNVDHENLALGQLSHLRLLAIRSLDTQQATEQHETDFQLGVDGWQTAFETKYEPNETICSAKGWIHPGTHTDKASWDSKFQVIVLGEERDDSAKDGSTLDPSLLVLRHQSGANLDLVTKLQDTSKDTTTGNTTLEILDLGTRLVDIEGSDNDHVGCGAEVSYRDGDLIDDTLIDGIDVVLQLCGDRNDR